MVKIDKHIPLNKDVIQKSATSGRPYKYPWKEMEVGDSFLTDSNCSKAAWTQSHSGKKFIMKKTHEGFRCWRVA